MNPRVARLTESDWRVFAHWACAEAEAARWALNSAPGAPEAHCRGRKEYADNNDLCSRFHDFMQENGLRLWSLELVRGAAMPAAVSE